MVFVSTFAFGWGKKGHRIVAEIAQKHLSDNAKNAIKKIIGRKSLANISTWPDDLYSYKNWSFSKPWHFLDTEDNIEVEVVLDEYNQNETIDNVVEAINFFTGVLKGEDGKMETFEDLLNQHKAKLGSKSREEAALSFLVHFLGDVHQPLHVGRTEDEGGNKIKVLWFGDESKLHAVWDEQLIEGEGLSFTEYARFLEEDPEYEEEEEEASSGGNPTQWAQESVDYRPEVYVSTYEKTDYKTGKPTLSYQYVKDNNPSVKKRLLKAGIRLAGRLNDIFKDNRKNK